MQTPSIGRVVYVLVDPRDNNGSDVAKADVTRVWSHDEPGGRWLVNYKITLDADTPDVWVTSAYLYADAEAARASGGSPGRVAFWPPRA